MRSRAATVDFPPPTTGCWRALSPRQRAKWLIAARDRQFEAMKRGERGPDAPAGAVFSIDGADISDLDTFFCALGEAVNGPGGYFGRTLLALEDCLYGAFGATLPFTLRVHRASAARVGLDGRALAKWARRRLDRGDYLDENGRQYLLSMETAGKGGTRSLFDEVVETLQLHGVTLELGGEQ